MRLISSTVARVPRNTAPAVNRRIADQTARRVQVFATEGRAAMERRLDELDREWDIERVIGTVAPIGILIGLTLGLTRNKRFFAVPAIAAAALIVHGVHGWAPPLPLLRRLGVRTSDEIDEERYALRALRGDFRGVATEPGIELVMAAVKH